MHVCPPSCGVGAGIRTTVEEKVTVVCPLLLCRYSDTGNDAGG
jgi:hypothetical protein